MLGVGPLALRPKLHLPVNHSSAPFTNQLHPALLSAYFSLHTLPVLPPADKRFRSQSQFHPILLPLLIYFGLTRMAHFLFLTFLPFLLLMVFKAQSVFHNVFNYMIGQ